MIERHARVPVRADLHERFEGYAILGQRFSSGHVLALRRWAAASSGPAYTSVWHRFPDGTWQLYANVPPVVSCARYIGSATLGSWEGQIRLAWADPYRLRVDVRGVGLEWEIDFRRTLMTRLFAAARGMLPRSMTALAPVARAIDWTARAWFALGGLSGVMPSGHEYRALPRRIWLMDGARAWLNGVSLGPPDPEAEDAWLGALSVPTASGLVFATAQFTQRADG